MVWGILGRKSFWGRIFGEIGVDGKKCDIMVQDADVAQLAEQLIRNEQVTGSIPAIGSIFYGLRKV